MKHSFGFAPRFWIKVSLVGHYPTATMASIAHFNNFTNPDLGQRIDGYPV